MTKILKTTKAISPIVATTLLFVVAITSVVSFQTWFGEFSSSTFSDVEIKSSNTDMNSGIETIVGNQLYFKNNIGDNLTITQIKIGKTICNISNGLNLSLGVQIINVENCTNNLTTATPEIFVQTKDSIYSKKVYLDDIKLSPISTPSYQNCTLDSITRDHGENYSFYNSTSVPFGNTCSFVLRTCNDGTYDGNTSFNYSSCSVGFCPLNTVNGLCSVCDGSGGNNIPTDDLSCGTIDCDGLDYYYITGTQSATSTSYCTYRNYNDITINRCEGLGDCKDANSADCTSYSNSNVKSAGVCKYISGCSGGSSGSIVNYGNGVSCGTNKKCDGSGNCVNQYDSRMIKWVTDGGYDGYYMLVRVNTDTITVEDSSGWQQVNTNGEMLSLGAIAYNPDDKHIYYLYNNIYNHKTYLSKLNPKNMNIVKTVEFPLNIGFGPESDGVSIINNNKMYFAGDIYDNNVPITNDVDIVLNVATTMSTGTPNYNVKTGRSMQFRNQKLWPIKGYGILTAKGQRFDWNGNLIQDNLFPHITRYLADLKGDYVYTAKVDNSYNPDRLVLYKQNYLTGTSVEIKHWDISSTTNVGQFIQQVITDKRIGKDYIYISTSTYSNSNYRTLIKVSSSGTQLGKFSVPNSLTFDTEVDPMDNYLYGSYATASGFSSQRFMIGKINKDSFSSVVWTDIAGSGQSYDSILNTQSEVSALYKGFDYSATPMFSEDILYD